MFVATSTRPPARSPPLHQRAAALRLRGAFVPGLVAAAPTLHPELHLGRWSWDLRGCSSQMHRPPRRHLPRSKVRRPPAPPPPARLPSPSPPPSLPGAAPPLARLPFVGRALARPWRGRCTCEPWPGAGEHGHGAGTRAACGDQKGSGGQRASSGHGVGKGHLPAR